MLLETGVSQSFRTFTRSYLNTLSTKLLGTHPSTLPHEQKLSRTIRDLAAIDSFGDGSSKPERTRSERGHGAVGLIRLSDREIKRAEAMDL
jgi:hypothetical protein